MLTDIQNQVASSEAAARRRSQYDMVRAGLAQVLTHPAYDALRALRQWFIYRLRPHPKKPDKLEKVPVSPAGDRRIDLTAPENWLVAHEAVEIATRRSKLAAEAGCDEGYTAGFCLTADDDINLVDLDRAYGQGAWSKFSLSVYERFPGAAFEVSAGLNGMHLLLRGKVPPGHRTENADGTLEFYSAGRGIALTGISATGCCDRDFTPELERLVYDLLPSAGAVGSAARTPPSLSEWNAKTEAQKAATVADLRDALRLIPAESRETWIDVGHALRGGLPDEVGFALWEEWSRTASTFDEEGLAKWPTFNTERSAYKAVFVRAREFGWGGVSRPAVDPSTINFGRVENTEAPDGADGYTMPAVTVPADRGGFATRELQAALWQGCVLVIAGTSGAPAVLMPAGQMISRAQFDAQFGGYEFMLGGVKNRTTSSAFDAFAGNQDIAFPRADAPGFRPQLPYQAIYDDGGLRMVNTYRALGRRRPGDASPMVDHVRRLFPVGEDATIVLSALAAMVQYPGRKFNWCLVLQSGPGAGKNMIANAMATALGERYFILLDEDDLASKFNGWLAEKLLCVFPELPARAARKAFEKLKTLITDGRGRGIERKGRDKVAANVCANFLFLTNHRDAIRKDASDRRFCVLYSAFQTQADLVKAGMGAQYFRALADWLADGGEEVFADWLAEFPIPEQYDPTKGAHVAPTTSATALAIELGRSDVAQVLADAIDGEAPGMAGDLISWGMAKTYALGRLSAREVTDEGLRQALESLGFAKWGKTDNVVMPDGRKTTLYLRAGVDLGGMSAAAVEKRYMTGQLAAATVSDAAGPGAKR